MKKKLNVHMLLPLLFAVIAFLSACKKNNDNVGAPVITSVRMNNPVPKDTILSTGNPNTDPSFSGGTGKYIAILGHNLQNATSIEIDGVHATYNPALFSPTSAVIQVPTIVFSTVDTTKLYTLRYVTPGGSTTFSFKLGAGLPTISSISNVFANPGDSVYLYGTNLVLVQHLVYGGTTIASCKSSLDGTALGFLMPASTPNTLISVTTKFGTVKDTINATPTIISVSDENAIPGDSVYVYGTYFKNIQKFTFAGTAINSFTLTPKGNSIGFVMPSISQGGPVSITTKFGTATTVYNVNDVATGSVASFEYNIGQFGWQYWGGANVTSGNPDFPGNTTNYAILNNSKLSPGEGNTYSSYAIRLQNETWVPSSNLSDPPGNWALKFEVSVPKLWNGPTIAIFTDFNNSKYVYRWEPWQQAATTVPYKTKGWITVTIPLSSFKAADATLGVGEGAALLNIADLTGPAGNNPQSFFEVTNYGTSTTATGFYGAFDNIRVVKIK